MGEMSTANTKAITYASEVLESSSAAVELLSISSCVATCESNEIEIGSPIATTLNSTEVGTLVTEEEQKEGVISIPDILSPKLLSIDEKTDAEGFGTVDVSVAAVVDEFEMDKKGKAIDDFSEIDTLAFVTQMEPLDATLRSASHLAHEIKPNTQEMEEVSKIESFLSTEIITALIEPNYNQDNECLEVEMSTTCAPEQANLSLRQTTGIDIDKSLIKIPTESISIPEEMVTTHGDIIDGELTTTGLSVTSMETTDESDLKNFAAAAKSSPEVKTESSLQEILRLERVLSSEIMTGLLEHQDQDTLFKANSGQQEKENLQVEIFQTNANLQESYDVEMIEISDTFPRAENLKLLPPDELTISEISVSEEVTPKCQETKIAPFLETEMILVSEVLSLNEASSQEQILDTKQTLTIEEVTRTNEGQDFCISSKDRIEEIATKTSVEGKEIDGKSVTTKTAIEFTHTLSEESTTQCTPMIEHVDIINQMGKTQNADKLQPETTEQLPVDNESVKTTITEELDSNPITPKR